MNQPNLNEYDNFDFGFTAVDSEESIVEKPVVNTQDIVQPVSDEIASLKISVDAIFKKLDNLEEVILAGTNSSFDIDSYKNLVNQEAKGKLKELESLIMPLLVNLKKNPTKDYIKWPNRVPIIDAQIAKILAITRAEQ